MGYTHYWTMSTDTSEKAIASMLNFAIEAISKADCEIVNWAGEKGTMPQIDSKRINLNGIEGTGGCETFTLFFNTGGRDYCKTNRRPYDALVVACLIRAFELEVIEDWSSDGDVYDHQEGIALYGKVMHESPKIEALR